MTALVTIEKKGGILALTLNRADKKNALTHEMYAALADGLDAAHADPDIRVVYITGSGDAFTAGNDLADFQSDEETAEEKPVTRFLRTLSTADKPIVAAVNGLAIGVGVTMLLHCDLVYAGKSATFQLPFVNLGLVPEAASSLLLPHLVGRAKAAELFLLGTRFGAGEAEAMGIVAATFDDDSLQAEATHRAEALAIKAPNAVRITKSLMRNDPESTRARMEEESTHFAAQLQSAEVKEAISAFFDKRAPDFSKAV